MDAILGVVIGSLATLIGTTIVPWIRDARGEKKRERKARRDALAVAVLDIIKAATDSLLDDDRKSTTMLTRREQASARLGLLLTTPEKAVADAVFFAFLEMIDLDRARAAALEALTDGLPKWYRGEMSPDEVLAQVTNDVAEDRRIRKTV